MEKGNYLEASNIFKLVLERMVPGDNYSFIGLANIAFQNALSLGTALQQPVPMSAQDPLMVKAFHKYLDILQHEPTNCHAALGVGNVLAFFGKVEDATEIYKLVMSASPVMA